MQFVALKLQNFMSYQDQEFDDLDHTGLTLIEGENRDEGGSNGSGKSAMWDAISFALFGKTARGLKGDEVINRLFKKNCMVDLELWLGGHKYIITRYRKHDDFGDRFIIAHNKGSKKETIEKGTLDMTQKWLEDEFKIDYELFKCTVLFSQGETFNFVDSGNKSQKEILSKIMKISYDVYLNKAKEIQNEYKNDLINTDRDLSVLRSHIKEPHELGYAEEVEEWRANHKSNLERVKKLVGAEPEAPDSERFKSLRDLAKKILDKVHALEEVTERAAKEKYRLEAWFGQEKASIRSMLGKDGKCPSCLQDVDKKMLKSLAKDKQDTLDEKKTAYDELEIEHTSLKKKRSVMDDNHRKVLSEIEHMKDMMSAYESKRDDYFEAKKEYDELKAEVNPFLKLIEEEKEQQKQILKKIEDSEKKMKQMSSDLPYYEFWVKAFGDSGIKSFVFDLICSNLTNRANKYINLMSKGSVSISFDTQKKLKSGELREKFDCEIIKNGERVEYASYSGGEKRRISLAVDMALADIMSDYHGSEFNMIVFDEQTSYLDAEGRSSFMTLLKDLGSKKSVFVVDHDAEFKSMFDEVWTIKKEKGISRLLT